MKSDIKKWLGEQCPGASAIIKNPSTPSPELHPPLNMAPTPFISTTPTTLGQGNLQQSGESTILQLYKDH